MAIVSASLAFNVQSASAAIGFFNWWAPVVQPTPAPTPEPAPARTAENPAAGSSATGSSSCSATEGASKAVNGTVTKLGNADKFCSLAASPYLQLDFGAASTIDQITIDHAQAGGESATYNTRAFSVRVSADGTNWSTVADVQNNTRSVTHHAFGARAVRFVRVDASQPAQPGYAAMRIYEVLARAAAEPTVPSVTTGDPMSVAACPVQPATKAFRNFDDLADYSLAPDGGFESDAAGWTLRGGSAVQPGNETLGIAEGAKSLRMPVGSTATSPRFCVDETHPHFRFAVRSKSPRSALDALVLYRDSAGKLTDVEFTSSSEAWDNEGDWDASPMSPLALKIPLLSTEPTASVQLLFASRSAVLLAGAPAIEIDSVMVDPYRRG